MSQNRIKTKLESKVRPPLRIEFVKRIEVTKAIARQL